MHIRRLAPMPVLLALFLVSAVSAQGFDSSLFKGMSWRNIGPNRGGRSIAVAGIPSRPNEYYFGAVGGGLWKTSRSDQPTDAAFNRALARRSVATIPPGAP